jgi:hypothetical protein
VDGVAIENFARAAIYQPLFGLNLGGLENDISEVPKQLTSELEDARTVISTLEDSSPEEEYEPERIVAERKTEGGVIEILIQWLGWPEEKDWAWEVEKTLEQSVPDLVASWRESKLRKEEPVNVEYIVEKILGKRKFNGVPHYLVAWKGFPLVEGRTWEPCQRLGVHVPHLVDAFEMKKGSRPPRYQMMGLKTIYVPSSPGSVASFHRITEQSIQICCFHQYPSS